MSIPGDDYISEPGYPAPWTTSLPLEGLRDTDEARIISLAPDVCRSPSVPVPYPVVDFCGHDENYTPSVRFTGQKAMVMRSHTSHVHGDDPGVGKGVKSNTVNGICEPIGHAAQVRAEGSHVIRHLDRFYMNDRNTLGEAIFCKDMAPRKAPKDDDPLPGSLRLADASGNWAQYAQAQAAPAARGPLPQPQPAPVTRPPGQVIRPNIPQWQRLPPTSPAPTGMGARLLRWGRWGARLGVVVGVLWPSELGDGTLPNWYHDLQSPDPFRRATAEEAERLYRQNPALRRDLEQWYRDETHDRPPVAAPEAAPQAVPQPDTVRVDDDEHRRRCMVASYRVMEKRCKLMGMQAHHIVPDWTLRTGTREQAIAGQNRIPNMPGFWDGNAICVKGQARVAGTEHNEAHLADGAIEAIGAASTPPHTAPLSDVTRISAAAMVAVRPDCAAEIVAAVGTQFGGLDQNQLLRAKQYPPLHPQGLEALRSGAVRGASGAP